MIPHIDPCLNPQSKSYILPKLSNVNFNGEYTLNVISQFEEEFSKSVLPTTANNPLELAVSKYGNVIYDATNSLNNDFFQRPYIVERLPEILTERLKNGPISALEFAGFISEFNYTPLGAIESSNANGPRFLEEFDAYYRGPFTTSIMGGFCSLFGNVFAALQGFFSVIGQVQGLISDALSFLDKIKNIEDPIKALFEKLKVKALIEALKEKIIKAVEGIINKVKSAIENFNPAQIMQNIRNFVQTQVLDRITRIKDDIMRFFSRENMQAILDKVRGLIDYAVGLFENPSLEEIMFLMARFCAFATGIEGLLNGLRAPLDDFANRYQEVLNTMTNASNRVMGESIRAGAIRFSEEVREQVINNQNTIWTNNGVPAPPTPQEFEGRPTWENLINGSDARLRAAGRWVTHPLCGRAGWDGMDSRIQILVLRIQEHMGLGQFTLLSGHRPQAYNDMLREESARRNGGVSGVAQHSLHIDGLAADITFSGLNEDSFYRLFQFARANGAGGCVYYRQSRFVHVDIGPVRSWAAEGGRQY